MHSPLPLSAPATGQTRPKGGGNPTRGRGEHREHSKGAGRATRARGAEWSRANARATTPEGGKGRGTRQPATGARSTATNGGDRETAARAQPARSTATDGGTRNKCSARQRKTGLTTRASIGRAAARLATESRRP